LRPLNSKNGSTEAKSQLWSQEEYFASRGSTRARKDRLKDHTSAIRENNGEHFEKSIGKLAYPGPLGISARLVTSRIPSMENDNVELLRLGRRIRTERKLLGLTQNGFAQDCGLNRTHFGGIERGERNLTFLVLCKICSQLQCDVAQVTHGIPRMSYIHDSKPG